MSPQAISTEARPTPPDSVQNVIDHLVISGDVADSDIGQAGCELPPFHRRWDRVDGKILASKIGKRWTGDPGPGDDLPLCIGTDVFTKEHIHDHDATSVLHLVAGKEVFRWCPVPKMAVTHHNRLNDIDRLVHRERVGWKLQAPLRVGGDYVEFG